MSLDGGFASKANLDIAKKSGVKDAVFHKKCGLEVKDMAKSKSVFKRLVRFRAGIEGIISALKRRFGMARAKWRGRRGFESYVWGSVVGFNAMTLARHLLSVRT